MLPFLLGDQLVARVDLKAERQERKLQVLSAVTERGAKSEKVVEALADELTLLAEWLALEQITVSDRGVLAAPLRSA